ncbi:MAG: phosphoribosylformylglycinamidine synthase subunit PurS, partial [Candidatus Omnitrophica bacterium]|nr:phosphoribosylformylglycinamidine synthase subunit PurS [Candidatus Omnitrophota bacterium]
MTATFPRARLKLICEELLVDKITQDYTVLTEGASPKTSEGLMIEVAYNPGVMDPVEESVRKGIRDLGIDTAVSVKTAKRYMVKGSLSEQEFKTISEKLLYNKLIQHVVNEEGRKVSYNEVGYSFNLIVVDLLNASDARLSKISSDGQLFLNLSEMRQI